MRYLLAIFFVMLLLSSGFAQEKREHFRGGMMLHSGFISNKLENPEIKGFCTGIGGKIVFPVMEHFRIGTEGYVSTYNYTNSEGLYKLGWGGLLAEYQFLNKRLMPVAGVTIGGGRIRDLYPLAGNFSDNDADVAIYKVYSSMIIAPQVSLEYKLTSHINLAAKADYLFYPAIDYPNYIARGPRLYVGVLFSR